VPVFYLEPSALVKYYVTEPGSTWIRQVVDEAENVLVSAEITIAEVAAALGVIARVGRISHRQRDAFWGQFRRDLLRRYELLPTRRTIINRAAALCLKHPLRGFDAIHLASDLRLRETLEQQGTLDDALSSTYVTSDDRLVTAAQAEALTVANPFWHIDLDTPPSS
jgi:predicted nucleic acid-binding protein